MLPKEEKITKKKSIDGEQPGLFDKENEKQRLVKKRRFIYIAMVLTVGLSLSFWIYRSIKNFDFSFKLPTLNFSVNSPKSSPVKTSGSISLPKDNSTWSILLKKPNSDSIIYQKNQDVIFKSEDLNSISKKIDQVDFSTSSLYASALPEGLKVKEITEEKDNSFSYFSKITSPKQEIILLIKITDSKDLAQAKKSLSDLINQLYWYSTQE